MIVQFRTEDNSLWMLDTELSQWAEIDKPADDPESKIIQSGDLTSLGYGRFALTPRTAKSPAPGAGLCTVAIMPVAQGQTLTICLSCNVPVREFTMPVPINKIVYEIISKKGEEIVPAESAETARTFVEEPPDKNCITTPNGDCVGTLGCMHDETPQAASN